MSLPALAATGASLHVAPAQVGSMMSLFMLGFAVAPLFCGPASDRYGRKPVVMLACALFIIAALGCALARSLSGLLMWRVVQGAGAGGKHDNCIGHYPGLVRRPGSAHKTSGVAIATMIVPTIAPEAGAALLALGDWRLIHVVLAGVGFLLFMAILLHGSNRPTGCFRPSLVTIFVS